VEGTNHFVTNSITVLIHSIGSSSISLSIYLSLNHPSFFLDSIPYPNNLVSGPTTYVTQPLHYSHCHKSDESIDPSFRLILDELQRMEAHLKDKIEGRCSGLEKYIVKDNRNLRSISSLSRWLTPRWTSSSVA
jgi:hypothetical protein